MKFLSRWKTKKETSEHELTLVKDMSDEEIKNDINDLNKCSGQYFASLGIAVSSHYEALDNETAEELLEGSIYYVKAINKAIGSTGNERPAFSMLYALLYYSYCANNALCADENWNEYFNGMRTTLDLLMTDKKRMDTMSGYA